MKHQSALFTAKWHFLLVVFILFGCAASEDVIIQNHKDEFIARPISEIKREMNKPDSYASRIGWKETTYKLVNGNYVYVEPVDENCTMHWEVNSEGTIVGGTAKGNGCELAPKTPDDMAHQKTSTN